MPNTPRLCPVCLETKHDIIELRKILLRINTRISGQERAVEEYSTHFRRTALAIVDDPIPVLIDESAKLVPAVIPQDRHG
jgi:hypothetical protein